MKKATTYREIAESLRRKRTRLNHTYSPEGVWFRASLGVDLKSRKVEAIEVLFKYYDSCVDTGEAGYCIVRVGGVEFRHWPYNREDWTRAPWESQTHLEEDGVTAAEVSALIDARIEIPDKLLVDVVDFLMSELVTKKVALECFKAKAEELDASYYFNENTGDIFLLALSDKTANLKKVSPKTALEVVWDILPLTCVGAC